MDTRSGPGLLTRQKTGHIRRISYDYVNYREDGAMAKFPIDPLSVTPGWLSDVLHADVRECRLEQIGIGVGLLGRLYRAHLVGEPDVPSSVVIKLPILDIEARMAICEDLEFYLREARFYQEIGLDNPLRPARPYFAAFDETTHDFILVLEDLGRLRINDQIVGCSAADAAIVIDAIARHHAYWWESDRLGELSWLKPYSTPPFPDVFADNCKVAWPRFLERIGADLSPALCAFGERLPSLVPWFLHEFARAPHTFVHGDLRLEQLFFARHADDAPVTALDWQITAKGRGAYDVAYFLSQSLTPEIRRSCESELIDRYAERLAEGGAHYPRDELWRDYRLTTAWCFAYPVVGAGRLDPGNDRGVGLLRTMLERASAAIEDLDALSLRPD